VDADLLKLIPNLAVRSMPVVPAWYRADDRFARLRVTVGLSCSTGVARRLSRPDGAWLRQRRRNRVSPLCWPRWVSMSRPRALDEDTLTPRSLPARATPTP
jgi:hypothetical protein